MKTRHALISCTEVFTVECLLHRSQHVDAPPGSYGKLWQQKAWHLVSGRLLRSA